MIARLIIFLVINFGALAIGSYFTGPGVSSEWYQNLDKAPWTPPGWVFGAAWTTIMICFSIFLALLWDKVEDKKFFIWLYVLQLILNISWNPVFFKLQNTSLGLVVISALAILVYFFLLMSWPKLKAKSLLVLPYVIWITIATSLNGYAWVMN